jgi:Ca-activated chloride channel homolog
MIPLLSSLAPDRLWLLLLIPLLVALYLWMMQRKRNRSTQTSKTMFDLVIPHRSAPGYGMLRSAGRSSAC